MGPLGRRVTLLGMLRPDRGPTNVRQAPIGVGP